MKSSKGKYNAGSCVTDDNPRWGNPNNFLASFRCTKTKYAKSFVEKGEIKFSTPQSWVEWELLNGKGRGDKLEGTLAFHNIFDLEKIKEFYEKYGKHPEHIPFLVDQRLYLKRKRSMQLPCFCFFIVKNSLIECPAKPGKQKLTLEIGSEYFRDFADNLAPKEVDKLPEEEKPAIILVNDYKAFYERLKNKLFDLGLRQNEIIDGIVKYYDYTQHGVSGWMDFSNKSPFELLLKDATFEHQSEARIIINTDSEKIKSILSEPIEIGALSGICDYETVYMHEGMRIEFSADIYIEE